MTRTRLLIVVGIVVFAGILGIILSGVAPARLLGEQRAILMLRPRHAQLHSRVSLLLDKDPRFKLAEADRSEVTLALSGRVMTSLLEEALARYLDRIELDLTPELDKQEEGELQVDTPLGHVKAGDWSVQVQVHHIEGVLSARKPTVSVADTNRFNVAVPIEVLEGKGRVTLHFKWDSKAVFNIVCRDFETTQTVDGSILPQEHVVRGDLVLSAGEETLVAYPDFPREKFPLSMTLSDGSWEQVRHALQKQDSFLKCGMLMSPDKVVMRLRALGIRGIKIKLPQKLFRPIVLPASISKSVRILKSNVELTVGQHELRITPGVFWYGAAIQARRSTASDSLSSPVGEAGVP